MNKRPLNHLATFLLLCALLELHAHASAKPSEPLQTTSHQIVQCPKGKEQQLNALLSLWKQKCQYWKHCNGKECRYDSTKEFDITSFNNFLLDMRRLHSTSSEEQARAWADKNLLESALDKTFSAPNLLNSHSADYLNTSSQKPETTAVQRNRSYHHSPYGHHYMAPNYGDFIRQTEDTRIRHMLEHRTTEEP